MLIKLNLDDKLFPKLLELDKNKLNSTILYLLNIGYQNVYSSVNEKNLIDNMGIICRNFKDDVIRDVINKNDSIKDKILLLNNNIQDLNINTKLDDFSNLLEKLFGISNSSSKKGEISEKLIYEILNEKYPNYCYDVKRQIAHHADGELSSPTGMKCLVEIKNYTNTVNKDELDKFKYDLKFTNNQLGIFISLQTGITNKINIDYETYQDNEKTYHIIYLSKLMNDTNKLDCGILLLENIYKIINKDNLDLKIDQIKNTIYHNFNELEVLINKTDKLRTNYDTMEKTIKKSLDEFYNNLRNYEIEIKQKMQKIWMNLFNDLKDIDKNYIDNKTEILVNIGKKDKCYSLMCRLFDYFTKKNINISKNKLIYDMNKGQNKIGQIKKMKDKIQLNLEELSICITFKYNDPKLDSNLEFMELLLDKI